jgi:hypothetical protein
MMSRLLLLLAGACSWAGDADFNGRWNIVVEGQPRVKWLDVQGAGTGALAGSFVGAPGGQVDKLPAAIIENGVLEFTFERNGGGKGPVTQQVYRFRVQGGELAGTMQQSVDGKAAAPVALKGKRAPIIRDKDDGSWKPGRTVELFDGKTTAGWRQTVPSRPGWVVENGLLRNLEKASDIISDTKFWNFELTAEYRYGKGSNSGIGLRGRYEVQIYDDFGRPTDLHGHGALYSRIPPSKVASRPPGEWQTMKVRLVGRDLTVVLNGETLMEKRDVYGPTAMAIDADEDQPGPIELQGDHGLIEFRRISVTELVRK